MPQWGMFPEEKQDKNIERIKDPETHIVQNCVTVFIYQC